MRAKLFIEREKKTAAPKEASVFNEPSAGWQKRKKCPSFPPAVCETAMWQYVWWWYREGGRGMVLEWYPVGILEPSIWQAMGTHACFPVLGFAVWSLSLKGILRDNKELKDSGEKASSLRKKRKCIARGYALHKAWVKKKS